MMQIVDVEEAIGLPLAHDITEIRPGIFKGPAFHRGHVVKDHDVDYLRRLGKDHLYILETEQDQLHEDDAVRELADALCGDGVGWEGEPREGKLSLQATRAGLLKIDVDILTDFNELGDVMCATQHTNTVVTKGQKVGGTRAIPLVIDRRIVNKAVQIAAKSKGVLRVLPLKKAQVGVLITGSEVYYGRIEDKFEPIVRKKVKDLGGTVLDVAFLPDDDDLIAAAALGMKRKGADIIITTGGMSVDPDDRTRFALKKAGAKELLYGSAALPGAMFMITQLEDVPVLGIPACGLHAIATVFDLIYPRVLAGEKITRRDLAKLGHGGMCLCCESCRFPNCTFGKTS
jgi:Probable molybdopterin binding domain